MKRVKCRECMLKRRGGGNRLRKGWCFYDAASIQGGFYGCLNGVSYKEVEQEKAKQEERKFVKPAPSKTTFLCKFCLYPVKVASDMLGQELRFKCFTCRRENHYDLTD